MSYINIAIRCPECEYQSEALVNRPAPDFGDAVMEQCPECQSVMVRAVNAATPLRASFHDGYRRGGGYEALKQAAKLKSERANMPNTEAARGAINKEIAAVTAAAGRESVKKNKGDK